MYNRMQSERRYHVLNYVGQARQYCHDTHPDKVPGTDHVTCSAKHSFRTAHRRIPLLPEGQLADRRLSNKRCKSPKHAATVRDEIHPPSRGKRYQCFESGIIFGIIFIGVANPAML